MGFHNIDSDAIATAATGITIVFVALILIAIFIALLPKILEFVGEVFPPPINYDAPTPSVKTDDGEILAAIGFICHEIEKQTKAKN